MHSVVLGDPFEESVPTPVSTTMQVQEGGDVTVKEAYRFCTLRAGWKQTMQVYMCFLLNDIEVLDD